MKRYVAALLVVLGVVGLVGVLAGGAGYAEDNGDNGDENASRAKCSDATLEGTYLFAYDGVEIKGDEQLPFALAGYDVFDGNGKVNTFFSRNVNGKITRNESLSGTYSVKANCTGTLSFADGTRFDQFIAPDGSKFTFVQTKPSELVSAGIDQQVTAKRVGD